ncbi:protein NDRG3 isoform X2 [Planococcus citri]|uniref:protein NDRG3 isoform X2 n=1 Tax=Planococcus citri TaxID=170843 RepID=UPI0031F8D93A
MPPGYNLAYHSLPDNNVYKSTTIPEAKSSILEYFKKVFNNANTSSSHFAPLARRSEPLINPAANTIATIVTNDRKMPSSTVSEEIRLLRRGMPADMLDDIELRTVQFQTPCTRSLNRADLEGVEEAIVETDRGTLLVAIQGDRRKPAILTYHDIGLNYASNFQAFFNYSEMRVLLDNFSVFHVNAPGQEEGAATLPENYIYPTMDELANQLNFVLSYFGLESVIGLGVGAGGNILARFAFAQPEKVEALILINVVSTAAGWIEWGYQKLNARYLKSKGMTQGVLDYLMWHHFGRGTEQRNYDLVQVYRNYFEKCVNPVNLALFIDSYVRRSDLNITRDMDTTRRRDSNATLAMPIMNITGAYSPHVDDTVTLNGRLDPTNSSWMKISDCGMVLEEQPHKVCEALRLFLQGLGYAFSYQDDIKNAMWMLRITENPISKIVTC